MSTKPVTQIVEVLEDEGEPLSRHELAERTDLGEAEFDTALKYLRGQQVVRYVTERDAFRLTYWPDQRNCARCGTEITGEEYYEIELRDQATNTESTLTGSIHSSCSMELFDELSLERMD
jgi:hypothetical protein